MPTSRRNAMRNSPIMDDDKNMINCRGAVWFAWYDALWNPTIIAWCYVFWNPTIIIAKIIRFWSDYFVNMIHCGRRARVAPTGESNIFRIHVYWPLCMVTAGCGHPALRYTFDFSNTLIAIISNSEFRFPNSEFYASRPTIYNRFQITMIDSI